MQARNEVKYYFPGAAPGIFGVREGIEGHVYDWALWLGDQPESIYSSSVACGGAQRNRGDRYEQTSRKETERESKETIASKSRFDSTH